MIDTARRWRMRRPGYGLVVRNAVSWRPVCSYDHVSLWHSKPQRRDLTPVLHRPVEPADHFGPGVTPVPNAVVAIDPIRMLVGFQFIDLLCAAHPTPDCRKAMT